jgi:hypothetical protein
MPAAPDVEQPLSVPSGADETWCGGARDLFQQRKTITRVGKGATARRSPKKPLDGNTADGARQHLQFAC